MGLNYYPDWSNSRAGSGRLHAASRLQIKYYCSIILQMQVIFHNLLF